MSNVVPIAPAAPLFAEPAGRRGDWWEPISVDASTVSQLLKEAVSRRLPIDLMAALLVERALVMSASAEAGFDTAEVSAVLGRAAGAAATAGPGRLHTTYVRMLRSGEQNFEPESEEQLARRDLQLPLRLHERVEEVDLATLRDRELNEAIEWEVASAVSGESMREWALRELLSRAAADRAARI